MKRAWMDVSVTLQSGMVHWPGDPEVRVARRLDMKQGAVCNVLALSLGAHTGTHMDAPLHFLTNGRNLDTMPLGILNCEGAPARAVLRSRR